MARNPESEVRNWPDQLGTFNIVLLAEFRAGSIGVHPDPSIDHRFSSVVTVDRRSALLTAPPSLGWISTSVGPARPHSGSGFGYVAPFRDEAHTTYEDEGRFTPESNRISGTHRLNDPNLVLAESARPHVWSRLPEQCISVRISIGGLLKDLHCQLGRSTLAVVNSNTDSVRVGAHQSCGDERRS